MAEKKVTMVMNVDLKCYRCYKKIKKVICKFPEIRDQLYDEKTNKVLIVVVSCCPERILEKIARKGGKTVESIEIVPEKKKEGEKQKEGQEKKEGAKPKEGEKKDEKKKDGEKDEKKKDGGKTDDVKKKDGQVHKHIAEPVSGYPTIYPSGMYYQPPQLYYQGYGAVPYHHGVLAYHSCDCFSEENPEWCTVM